MITLFNHFFKGWIWYFWLEKQFSFSLLLWSFPTMFAVFDCSFIKTGLENMCGICCLMCSSGQDMWIRCTFFRLFSFNLPTKIGPNFACTLLMLSKYLCQSFHMLFLASVLLERSLKNMLFCLFTIWRKTDAIEVGFISSSTFGWLDLFLIPSPTIPSFWFCYPSMKLKIYNVQTYRLTLYGFLLN